MRPRLLFLALAALLPAHLDAQQPAPAAEVLHPGDVLRVTVYQEKDLSGEFLVNEDGVATLPLLGERRVTGIALPVLRDSLRSELRRQLRAPAIEITPLRRVFLVGEVVRPGPYVIDPTITLSGAVAMAGGANTQGNLRDVRVVRRDGTPAARVDLTEGVQTLPLRSGDQIHVGRRSWASRNSPLIVSSLVSLTGIVASVVIAANR